MLIDALRAVFAGGGAGSGVGCGRAMINGPEELLEVRRLLDRVEAEWFGALHECVSDGSLEAGSGLSSTEWLATELGRTSRDAHGMVRFASRLARTSLVADGLADGTLSLG